MKVNDLEINEITFGEERELYNLYKKAYRNSKIDYSSGEVSEVQIDWEAHDYAVARAIDLAFDKPEEALKDMSHPDIDTLAQKIIIAYLRADDESKKE